MSEPKPDYTTGPNYADGPQYTIGPIQQAIGKMGERPEKPTYEEGLAAWNLLLEIRLLCRHADEVMEFPINCPAVLAEIQEMLDVWKAGK
jgi:hypothetical protein